MAILPLLKLVKTNKPDYLILHLIVIPALFISSFYKINTKFILRISGYPKLNLFRKFFWNFFSKNLFMIFSPTRNTINLLREKKIFEKKKIELLEDPIIEISQINKLKRESLLEHENNYLFLNISSSYTRFYPISIFYCLEYCFGFILTILRSFKHIINK